MVRRKNDLTAVRGVSVGQAESEDGSTGVTVVRFAAAAPTVVDVRGGASATYDTASLSVDATFGRRWAVFFSGGSIFGLDAARGVRARVLASGGGHRAFGNPNRVVPISGAALFDLPTNEGRLPDYEALGARAAQRASRRPVALGAVGAGAGATVGKYLGRGRSMRGGVGTSATRIRGGPTVGVLVVVNSVGAVRDPATGRWVAGARAPRGGISPPDRAWNRAARSRGTTLALVATDAPLDRPALARIAAIVHTGLARAIVPYHTSTDGDVVFAVTTGGLAGAGEERSPGATADRIGIAGADRAVAAVLSAVRRSNRAS
ncbi:MAG TPA: P1 family peptidase [Thermoplasmata archaeon]|nr:P1 family peptidase [Thermoplasmata archaeon]